MTNNNRDDIIKSATENYILEEAVKDAASLDATGGVGEQIGHTATVSSATEIIAGKGKNRNKSLWALIRENVAPTVIGVIIIGVMGFLLTTTITHMVKLSVVNNEIKNINEEISEICIDIKDNEHLDSQTKEDVIRMQEALYTLNQDLEEISFIGINSKLFELEYQIEKILNKSK
jgi:hypothetical protein